MPSYEESMRAQPRAQETLPPPRYEFPPAYTERASTTQNNPPSGERATSLTANRITSFHSTSQANRGMSFMGNL
jgi:hypothetical protein